MACKSSFTKNILTLDWTHAGGTERKGSPLTAKHRLETRLATRWLVTSQTDPEAWGTSKDAWKFQDILDGEIFISLARHSLPLCFNTRIILKGLDSQTLGT